MPEVCLIGHQEKGPREHHQSLAVFPSLTCPLVLTSEVQEAVGLLWPSSCGVPFARGICLGTQGQEAPPLAQKAFRHENPFLFPKSCHCFPSLTFFVKLELGEYTEVLPESKRNGKSGGEGVTKRKLLIQINETQMGKQIVMPHSVTERCLQISD